MSVNKNFHCEKIAETAKAYGACRNPLEHINDYSDKLSISQVVRFFEKQGIDLTKTMIQNYVRLGLLPMPLNKRYYTKEHLMLLTMIIRLKDLYSLEVLRTVFGVSSELSENTHIQSLYDAFINTHQEVSQDLGNILPGILSCVERELKKAGSELDKRQIALTVLGLMVNSAVAKQIADAFIENHLN